MRISMVEAALEVGVGSDCVVVIELLLRGCDLKVAVVVVLQVAVQAVMVAAVAVLSAVQVLLAVA